MLAAMEEGSRLAVADVEVLGAFDGRLAVLGGNDDECGIVDALVLKLPDDAAESLIDEVELEGQAQVGSPENVHVAAVHGGSVGTGGDRAALQLLAHADRLVVEDAEEARGRLEGRGFAPNRFPANAARSYKHPRILQGPGTKTRVE
jgi:hypothetical protein